MRALVAAALAAAVPAAAVAATPLLPMTGRYYVPSISNVGALRLTGRLPTTAAGERVTILGKECTYRFYRQITGTQTLRGGGWEVDVGGPYGKPGDMSSGMTYRARWRGRWSVPFTFRWRMNVSVKRLGGDRFRVSILGDPSLTLNGKPVALQRSTGGGWVAFQTRRLTLVPGTGGRTYSATFVVRTSGLRLRALAPMKTARPCYNPGASENFTT